MGAHQLAMPFLQKMYTKCRLQTSNMIPYIAYGVA